VTAAVRDAHLPGDAPPRPRRAPGRYGTGHPAQLPVCACQWGPSGHCLHGDHARCRAAEVAGPRPETHLTYAGGPCVLDVGAPVSVWLADRTCRWTCTCEHHTAAASPRIAGFRRTYLRPGADAGWLWDPWEYVAISPGPLDLGRVLHRADPDLPTHTMCGDAFTGPVGNPSAFGRPHCPECAAAPAPPRPTEFFEAEFARHRTLPDGRRVDVLSIQHTTDRTPEVWQILSADGAVHRDVADVIAMAGWVSVDGPHYDPRTDTTRARVIPAGPLQAALF